ncbi:1-acyl-sn-glycerol-3-phosphate acyltransferase [Acinetobacter qingfengensis]|uniref:Acyltransferase n=1 Tax=Acinetobacter qingfengensis TaxID=1262585 RepID=A0A1E7RFE2_9GAMM|nr:lysophospholipid acyltransferase family protein [Acinetobacter qingfengensis]KAA8731871.1 1-acyl-sn-glycerol-3-phosphate acyltransferase [Acinetobacter qingfengensis]OEY98006.1 acyltransferase [Acinetobacter qingfengensis]
MTTTPTPVASATLPPRNLISRALLYSKKALHGLTVLSEGFYIIFRYDLYKQPNNPKNTRYIQYFCRKFCKVFNVKVQIHGEIPRHTALWASNHVSWLDIIVLGAGARVFFLSKAEVKNWPIIGHLAKWGGTLFIKRGSGDSSRVKEQIAIFLKQDIPVLFFPEATTGDGRKIKKIHGRLLEAAIEARQPVQACVLCYSNTKGELDQIVPFINDQTFIDSVTKILQMDQVTAHLKALPAIDSSGHSVESLTKAVQDTMTVGLYELQTEVLGEHL